MAVLGKGTTLAIAGTSWVEDNIQSIDIGDITRTVEETTHLGTTQDGDGNIWKTFIPGVKDGGTMSLTVQYATDNPPPIGEAGAAATITVEDGSTFVGTVFNTDNATTLDTGLTRQELTFKVSGDFTFTSAYTP